MQTLKEVTASADRLHRYSSMSGALHGEFSDFKTAVGEIHTISSPFTCSVDIMMFVNLHSDKMLAEHFRSVSLTEDAQKMLVVFGSTYMMYVNKHFQC